MNDWDLYAGIERSFLVNKPIVAIENDLIIPLDQLKFNCEYQITLLAPLSLGQETITQDMLFTFCTEMKPLYVSPKEIEGLLLEFINWFEVKQVMIAIKNAGAWVHSLLDLVSDPNLTGYVEIESTDDQFHTVRELVKYTASIALLQMAHQKMIANDGATPFGSSASSIQLGDFMVSSPSGGNAKHVSELIAEQIKYFQSLQKIWLDRLNNRTLRSYSKPNSAVMRKNVIAPTGRGF